MTRRWDPAVSHRGPEAETFVREFFGGRRVVAVAGAGFDPRARIVLELVAAAGAELKGILIRETRPDPPGGEVSLAEENQGALEQASAGLTTVEVAIFDTDGAVVGGRNAVLALRELDLDECTDVIVDLSALSVGVSFPIVRYLLERILSGDHKPNMHLFITHNPVVDDAIRSIAGDTPNYLHGYKGGSTLDAASEAARLWLPQLASGAIGTLTRLHDFVEPHDTCPILPFPARDPRAGDRLAEEYVVQLQSAWQVDPRNVVYADEGDPLDLYRTVLQMHDLREPVFAHAGGSRMILSPLGSKVTALGALLAALECDLPVAHLETISYEMDGIEGPRGEDTLLHVWLEGEAYPAERPPLRVGPDPR
jgi:hypothetical protein